MTQRELLEELKKLPTAERLTVVEAALRLIRDDLQKEVPLAQTETRERLAAAAQLLLADYAAGGELTVFTALDGEDVHAEHWQLY